MTTEILAPAGGIESLVAAVRCGANAVYFGGKAFNARRNAANFTHEEIKTAVEYCHSHGVKVYVTLNTLATDKELCEAQKEIIQMADMGIDAFIIQDLGLAALVRQVCPHVFMHASTQMSVQSSYGFKILEDMGFVRAVVPRELTKEEIKEIHKNSNLEMEAFVHGALCMCLSGQCLMSSVLGGRSGNRGLCAQPCRLPFGVNGKGGNNLSLKDLSLVKKIPEMEEAGVVSFKIEGRMKRPEYVAAAVTACKNSINGKNEKNIDNALEAVFSRSGFTSGYFDNSRGKNMFGIRTKEDVTGAPAVLNELKKLYEKENPLIPVNMHFEMKKGEKAKLTLTVKDISVIAESENVADLAVNKPITFENAKERLSKCGGTQFYVEGFTANMDEGLNMSASALNGLRRNALKELEEKFSYKEIKNSKKINLNFEPHKSSGKELHLRFFSEEQIPEKVYAHRVIIPLETSEKAVKSLISQGVTVAAEIPVNVFSNGENYLKKLSALKSFGVKTAWCCNLDGVQLAKESGMKISLGFGMNILNTLSISEAEKLGATDCLLSAEISAKAISELGGNIKRGIVAYGRLPLMVTRNCPVKNKLSCGECKGQSCLTDRKGISFPVRCKNGCSFILNSVPLCVYDRQKEINNTDFDLLYFTTENKEDAERIICAYNKKQSPDYDFTRGLYFRNVL